MAKVKNRLMAIQDILGLDKKTYSYHSANPNPELTAFKNMCDKMGNKEAAKTGKITPVDAFLLINEFKKYKDSLPPRHKRMTAAQRSMMSKIRSFYFKDYQ